MLAELRTVSKSYHHNGRHVRALRDVSLQLFPGQFIAIQGKSGCGKSSLLLTLGGLLTPDSGLVVMGDQDVYSMSPSKRAAWRSSSIGFVFQQFHLIPYLSVRDNVLAARIGQRSVSSTDRGRADELLATLGLSDRATHRPSQLSIGERQRTALARALFNSPKLLLADEPTGNLDPDNASIVLDQFRQFTRKGGTVLLVTHDTQSASRADSILTMSDGAINGPR